MQVGAALLQATRLMDEDGIAVPRLTAEVLLAHILGRDRAWLYAHSDEELGEADRVRYTAAIRERRAGKPTQYITGRQEFWGREFTVTPDVLIPRPETEHVVETALETARDARRILDVGCGSGILAITLGLETGAETWATDISVAALRVAVENARRLKAPVRFAACDLMSAIGAGAMDLIVSNPPYVPLGDSHGLQREVRDYEPHTALFAGPSGLEIYERLVADAARVLRPGGRLVMELGFGASARVAAMFGPAWGDLRIVPDLAGIPRVAVAVFSPKQ